MELQGTQKGIVAYQGRPGANSELACIKALPDWQRVSCSSFADAFAMVTSGKANIAMIPIENSTAGRVADIHLLLPESGLHIAGEYFLPIHHQMVAPKGSKLEDIKTVYSHEQALSQCRKTLHSMGIEGRVSSDTAAAAEWIALQKPPHCAALAGALAARQYELEVLVEDMNDYHDNTTRFVILSNQEHYPEAQGKAMMTSLLFELSSIPAALYKALGGFATNGINLTKLESYVTPPSFEHAQFYVDVEGHINEKRMHNALAELGFFSKKVVILGSYPADEFRYVHKQVT